MAFSHFWRYLYWHIFRTEYALTECALTSLMYGYGLHCNRRSNSGVREFTMTAESLFLSAVPLTFSFPFLISVLRLLRVHVVWYAHISLCHDVLLQLCQHTAELLGSYTCSKETLKSS